MRLNYFYSDTVDQFTFYRVPKMLFVDDEFNSLTIPAKLLYGLLLDRSCLSASNGWTDDYNRVYIIFTIDEIMEMMACARQKVSKMLKELESIGLIERKRQGLGKPNLIYVKDFRRQFKSFENHKHGDMNNENVEVCKSNGNNTELNKNKDSDNNLSFYPEISEFDSSREALKEQIELDSLLQCFSSHQAMVYEIFEILLDTLNSTSPSIRIGSEYKDSEQVKNQLRKLKFNHIQYVMNSLLENTSKVKNIYAYLLTSLYNATFTIDSYYTKLVNHDLNGYE